MDFRTTQDNEMMRTTSAGYGGGAIPTHLTKESLAAEKRRLSNIIQNGSTPTPLSSAFTSPHHQTLDHHGHHHHHILQPHHVQPVPLPLRDPDPDHRLILSNNNSVVATPTSVKPTNKTNPPPPPLTSPPVRYRECLKNHAANIGGNVYDGCGEFMPCGEECTIEALKCAACYCHRNFHRKETDGETHHFGAGAGPRSSSSRSIMLSPLQLPPPLPSPHPNHHHHRNHQKFSIVQPMSVAFGAVGTGGGESSSEELNIYDNADGNVMTVAAAYGTSSSKKRFRTKFTAEQKERMVEFAERVGWRIQKQDEEDVERFCDELGVKRQVLRVWMHNNKNTAAKSKLQLEHDGITATTSQLALENNVEPNQQ